MDGAETGSSMAATAALPPAEHALTVEEWAVFSSLRWEREAWRQHGEALTLRERVAQMELARRLELSGGVVEIDVAGRRARWLPERGGVL